MKIFTNTFTWTLFCLFLSTSLFSSTITILESQSVHPLHKMDVVWKNFAASQGHNSTVVDQAFLNDYSNLENTEVLIISSGLIDIPDNSMKNVLQFVMNGGSVYVQSEYLLDLPGNTLFKYISDNLGGEFEWIGEVTGNLNPMKVVGSLAEGLDEEAVINYYWYGTYGAGDEHFIPFLKYDDKDWGFIYCSPDIRHGRVITTSDQDWIRTSNNDGLMANILKDLINHTGMETIPTVSIENLSAPCEEAYIFEATIENNIPEVQIRWYINGELITNEEGLTYTTDNLTDGDVVEAQIFLTNDCVDYNHVSNPILIAPIFPTSTSAGEITVSVDHLSICEGQTANFTASTSQLADATNMTYQWLVNGEPVAGASVQTFSSNTLNDQDLITCQLIYDEICQTGLEIISNEVSMNVAPVLNPEVLIFATVTEVCEGDLVTFIANGTDLGSNPVYQWEIDGVPVVGNNSATFSTNTITNGQNINCNIAIQELCSTTNEANSNTISITVNEVVNPSIEIVASTDVICSGEMVTITAIATDFGTNATYQWQIDGLNVGTNQPNFSTTTLEDGQQITCILSVAESCTNSAVVTSAPISLSVSQGSIPTLSISSDRTIICAGETATFIAGGEHHGPNPVYEWFVDGVSTGINDETLVLDNVLTTQEITCTVLNESNCSSLNTITSNAITLAVSDLNIGVVDLSAEHCNSIDGMIEVLATGGLAPYTYEWSNGMKSALIAEVTAGNYEILVTDANGCSAARTIELTNKPAPQITNVLVDNGACEGDNGTAEITLENVTPELEIEWINEDGIVLSNELKVYDLLPGIYEIAVTNEYGCETFETITIEENRALSVAVETEVKLELGTTTELQMAVNISDDLTYEWYPAEGLSCTDCANPTANPTSSIKYTLTVTNAQGCTSTDEVLVYVIPNDDIFIPNAFSPNGDGVNDNFTAFGGSNIAQIKTLKVFNRWGAQVFGNENFSVNIESEGWDGMFKGQKLTTGVFVYYIEVEYTDGRIAIKKGDLSITK